MNETSASGALEGIRIIDLSRVLGGPYCSQMLADHGAQVLKIEPPLGDETREWGPPFHAGDAAYYLGVNRNKRALGLDLTRSAGRDVLLRLLEDADILLENFKPGTLEKWGLGFEAVLRERFPRLIHCRISGFGADGPLGGYPGYDAIVQAMAGWFSVNGEAGGAPMRLGLPMVDMGTGLYSAVAILMALAERSRSGLGQFIDMTLYDCALALLHPHAANYALSGKVPVATGNAHPNISPYDTFRTGSVDIFIGAGNDAAFAKLCEMLAAPELCADPRFARNSDRVTQRAQLKVELESRLMRVEGAAFCERLLQAGVPAGAINDTAQALAHPHTAHRGMFLQQDGYGLTGTPIKFSRTPGSVRSLPPRYGEHTREVLLETGLSEAEIQHLLEAGVVLEHRRER